MKPSKGYKLGDVTLYDCGGHRLSSRSVSWSNSGQYLAIASSDRMTRLWTLEGSSSREVLVVSGHSAPVDRVRFHPSQDCLMCTTASDSTVRLWDVRSATQKSMGRIDVQSGSAATDIAWCPAHGSSLLAVTERDGSVIVYDTRKLSHMPTTFGAKPSRDSSVVHSFSIQSNVVDTCIFSPASRHLVAATTSSGMGELMVWNWKDEDSKTISYPAHTGPIYSLAFSPDGDRLATGGSDAIVGLWDTDTIVCLNTISRCTKFIRSIAFSHDSKFIASSSEEDDIDLALAGSGELVGKIGLGRRGGADEIACHPKAYLIACARCPGGMGATPAAVTVAKISVTTQ